MEPSSFRLAFAPPFVFIRGSRGTLTATCQCASLSVSSPDSIPTEAPREERTRSTRVLGGGRYAGPGEAPGKAFRPARKRGRREKWHVCRRPASHDYVIFPRASATRIYYSDPRQPPEQPRSSIPSPPSRGARVVNTIYTLFGWQIGSDYRCFKDYRVTRSRDPLQNVTHR